METTNGFPYADASVVRANLGTCFMRVLLLRLTGRYEKVDINEKNGKDSKILHKARCGCALNRAHAH